MTNFIYRPEVISTLHVRLKVVSFFCLWFTFDIAQGLLLAVHSGIFPDWICGTI